MTAREKLAMEHPEKLDDLEPGGCLGCPEDYGYLPNADFCMSGYDQYGDRFERCKKCWDREIPEELKEEKENCMPECCKETICTSCIHREVCGLEGTFLTTQNEINMIDIAAFIRPVKLECIHYIPKNSTFMR